VLPQVKTVVTLQNWKRKPDSGFQLKKPSSYGCQGQLLLIVNQEMLWPLSFLGSDAISNACDLHI
jgi:hypothetical protein